MMKALRILPSDLEIVLRRSHEPDVAAGRRDRIFVTALLVRRTPITAADGVVYRVDEVVSVVRAYDGGPDDSLADLEAQLVETLLVETLHASRR